MLESAESGPMRSCRLRHLRPNHKEKSGSTFAKIRNLRYFKMYITLGWSPVCFGPENLHMQSPQLSYFSRMYTSKLVHIVHLCGAFLFYWYMLTLFASCSCCVLPSMLPFRFVTSIGMSLPSRRGEL